MTKAEFMLHHDQFTRLESLDNFHPARKPLAHFDISEFRFAVAVHDHDRGPKAARLRVGADEYHPRPQPSGNRCGREGPDGPGHAPRRQHRARASLGEVRAAPHPLGGAHPLPQPWHGSSDDGRQACPRVHGQGRDRACLFSRKNIGWKLRRDEHRAHEFQCRNPVVVGR